MNILHLRASNFYGGPERQLHFHAREARDTDYTITVASFSEQGQEPEFLTAIKQDGINTHVFEVSSAYDRRAIATVREYLRTHNIAIICTHDYRTVVIGYLAARNTPTAWLAFSRGFTQDNLKVRLYHTIDKILIRRADHIVAVSGAQRERLKKLWISGKRISVVDNAIDPGSFAAVEPVDLRARYGFPQDSVVCISGGRFSREKGQAYLIEAAARALETNPHLRFVLFGDGPDLEAMRDEVKKYGCDKTILCPGFERNLIGCLKGADMLINPSLSEGLPNIVLEAMALGVVVVATAVGGVPELIEDGRSGYLVPPGNAAALAETLALAVEQLHRRNEITRTAGDHILSHYSFSDQYRKLTAIYERFGRG
ncbi:MAG: glycosyltransferase [candidate division Zixibacteria bacterium]|nr:glycosyltransferase [candidate division Zixibacteria bacterium]